MINILDLDHSEEAPSIFQQILRKVFGDEYYEIYKYAVDYFEAEDVVISPFPQSPQKLTALKLTFNALTIQDLHIEYGEAYVHIVDNQFDDELLLKEFTTLKEIIKRAEKNYIKVAEDLQQLNILNKTDWAYTMHVFANERSNPNTTFDLHLMNLPKEMIVKVVNYLSQQYDDSQSEVFILEPVNNTNK